MRTPRAVLALVVLASAAVARADEPKPGSPEAQAKADELMKDARAHYGDADPKRSLEAAEKAFALAPNDVQVMGFLGTLHEIKTGDTEKALVFYDKAIRALIGVTSKPHLRLKADIMSRKANLLYSEKDDVRGAADLYQSSFETFQLSQTADKASNLFHRLSGVESDATKKADWAKKALGLAQNAYELLPSCGLSGDKAKAYAAKVRTQLAICLEAMGEKEKAASALANVPSRDFDETCAYNQALLEAIRGKADEATEHLKASLKIRPTARARNRLRKLLRTEPDFRELAKRPDWKDLIEDEPEDGAPKPAEGAKPEHGAHDHAKPEGAQPEGAKGG